MYFGRLSRLTGTLRLRLTVWNVVVILVTSGATLIGVRQGVRWTILHEMDQILIEDLYEIEYKFTDAGTTVSEFRSAARSETPSIAGRLLEDLNRKARGHVQHGWFVKLRDEQNRLVWSSENAPPDLRLDHAIPNFEPWTTEGFRIVQNRDTSSGYSPVIVRVGASTEFLYRDMRRIDRLVGMVAIVMLLIAPPIGYWLAGRATRPLGAIIRTASRLRPNHMEERLPIGRTGDELDQLARTVNRMLDRIADYLEERRDFLANSAHELRSPLAAIRSTAEVALGSPRSNEEYENLLLDVIEECETLELLVNQLLLLSETENLSLRSQGEPVDFSGIVERASDMFQAVAESRNVLLDVAIQPGLFVIGHRHHLRQVLNNLIDNALKFTVSPGTVEVNLRAEDHQAVLTVRDTGIGISAEDQPRIFERFFRGDRAHSRDPASRGTGLGLSICQGVIESHNGGISVTSEPGRGTTFTVSLPLADEFPSDPPPAAVTEANLPPAGPRQDGS